ncbi:DUF1800 family protein, partial [Frateuria defendens]|uniref:DUF1800 family protein n=1 Tax=Frateuria defendens TaxID=2219559 RepID=UPI00066FCEEE
LNQLGEAPYARITPDGYALDGASWSGSGQMAKRFDVAAALGSGRNRLFMPPMDNEAEAMPPPASTAGAAAGTAAGEATDAAS